MTVTWTAKTVPMRIRPTVVNTRTLSLTGALPVSAAQEEATDGPGSEILFCCARVPTLTTKRARALSMSEAILQDRQECVMQS